nr:hypothetical protein [uncultured Arsenicibacter sp.]
MSTLELRSSLHVLIDQIDDNEVLQAIRILLSREMNQRSDFWDELTVEQKESIDKGIADLNAGRKTSFAEVLKKYQ